MTYPLISIIVPVYKVEEYLPRCVDSLLGQTYPNIEIVLVDDGSPDRCGQMCDNYAQADNRVRVIHRPNGGLSAARNSGLDECHGEYVGFVDSDDYVLPDMYEQLYSDIVRHQTLLAFCHTDVIRNGRSDEKFYGTGSEAHPNTYVIRRALEESIWWSAWTKLYHKSLFNDLRFPEGKTNEDLPVTIRIYDRCDRIAINYNKLYCYCIRKNSITTSKLNPHKFDILDNASDVLSFVHQTHPEMEAAAKGVLLSNALRLLLQVYQAQHEDLLPYREKILQIIRKHWPSLVFNRHLNLSQKLLLTAARIHPSVFRNLLSLKK